MQYIDIDLFYDRAEDGDQCEQCGYLFDKNERVLCDEAIEVTFCSSRCRQAFRTNHPLTVDLADYMNEE